MTSCFEVSQQISRGGKSGRTDSTAQFSSSSCCNLHHRLQGPKAVLCGWTKSTASAEMSGWAQSSGLFGGIFFETAAATAGEIARAS